MDRYRTRDGWDIKVWAVHWAKQCKELWDARARTEVVLYSAVSKVKMSYLHFIPISKDAGELEEGVIQSKPLLCKFNNVDNKATFTKGCVVSKKYNSAGIEEAESWAGAQGRNLPVCHECFRLSPPDIQQRITDSEALEVTDRMVEIMAKAAAGR